MDQELIDFINKHEDLIDDNNWEEFYKISKSDLPPYKIGALTDILLQADVHPEHHLSNIPSNFLHNSQATSFIIPEGITEISYGAFLHCKNLNNIMIPDTVTSIGDSAFYDCYSLTEIDIPNNVTHIGKNAFQRCLSLHKIVLSNNLNVINDVTFYLCTNLVHIDIPNGVTDIGLGAFEGCSNLATVVLPESINHIGESAFERCGDITIHFASTKKHWNKIYNKNSFHDTYFVVHCTDGVVVKKKR